MLRIIVRIRKHLSMSLLILLAMSCSSFVFSQNVDLAGNWAMQNMEDYQAQSWGPDLVDYLGLPINDEARNRGLAWDANVVSTPERQCLFYNPVYLLTGPFGLSIWNENDPASGEVVAWHIDGVVDMASHVIWMDGREPPSDLAPRTVGGKGYGKWIGNTLKVEFPHFMEGYLTRNGLPSSAEASMTMFINVNDTFFTATAEIWDPVYMTEPVVFSQVWRKNEDAQGVVDQTGSICTPTVEVPSLNGTGQVPHFLPGQNPFLNEFAELRGLPLESVLGGEETMYPGYRDYISERYERPAMCPKYCCTPSPDYPQGCPAP